MHNDQEIRPSLMMYGLAAAVFVIGIVGVLVFVTRIYRKVEQGHALVINRMRKTDVSFLGGVVLPVFHKAEIMDISFALQALTLRYIVEDDALPPALYAVPHEVDERVARMKLAALGVAIDSLTEQQQGYLGLPDA